MAVLLGTVAMAISGVAFLLDVVALAIPYWLYYGSTVADFNLGLWKACSNILGETHCQSVDTINGFLASDSTYLNLSRGCVNISTLLLFGAMLCHILKNFVTKQLTVLHKIAGIGGILGGVFGIAGSVVFAVKFNSWHISSTFAGATLSLHAGFGLCIVASVKGIVSGAMSFFIRGRNWGHLQEAP